LENCVCKNLIKQWLGLEKSDFSSQGFLGPGRNPNLINFPISATEALMAPGKQSLSVVGERDEKHMSHNFGRRRC